MIGLGGSKVMSWWSALSGTKKTPPVKTAPTPTVVLELVPDGKSIYSTMLEEGQRIDIVDFEPIPGTNGGRTLRTRVAGARVRGVRVAAPSGATGAALPFYFVIEADRQQAEALGAPSVERPFYLMSAA